MGGYDIFTTTKLENGEWNTPLNIGFPLNTTKDNTYFVPVKDGMSGLYTRFTDECVGKEDLWFIEILKYDREAAKSLSRLTDKNFNITLTDDSGQSIFIDYDAVTDRMKVRSTSGKKYRVVYSRDK